MIKKISIQKLFTPLRCNFYLEHGIGNFDRGVSLSCSKGMQRQEDPFLQSKLLYNIYDCLDNQNPKQALNLCLKARKKYPNSIALQSINALTCLRLGKIEEANILIEKLLLSPPIHHNDTSLFALRICLIDLERYTDCIGLFEQVFQRDPADNIENGIQLFLLYCYSNEFQKQYQLATKLFKTLKEVKFLYWGITSLELQSKNTTNDISIKIALKMVEIIEGLGDGINSLNELELLITIYKKSHLIEKALNLLIRFKHFYLQEEQFNFTLVSLLDLNFNWKELYFVTRSLVFTNGELNLNVNFIFIELFIKSCWKLKEGEGIETQNDNLLENTSSSLDTFLVSFRSHSHSFLDDIESLKQIESSSRNGAIIKCKVMKYFGNENEFTTSILQLYNQTKGKDCCFYDVYYFTRELNQRQKEEIEKELIGYTNESCNNSLVRLIKTLNEESVNLPTVLSNNSIPNIFYSLIMKYLSSYSTTTDTLYLNSAYLLVSELVSQDPSNFYYQIIFIAISQQLGLFLASYEEFERLAVKNIQLDLLLFLVCENSSLLGHFDISIDLFKRAFQLYHSNGKEISDLMQQSFRQSNYLQTIDFYSFKEKLENSLQWFLLEGETLLIDPLIKINQLQDLNLLSSLQDSYSNRQSNISQLNDNRDFSILEIPFGKIEFLSKLFAHKTVSTAQLYSLIQLICKKYLENKLDEIEELKIKYEKYLATDNNTSVFMFNFFYKLFFDKQIEEALNILRNQINTTLQITTMNYEERVQLTQLVICFCYSCLFVLIRKVDKLEIVVVVLKEIGNELIDLINHIELKPFDIKIKEMTTILECDKITCHLERIQQCRTKELTKIKNTFTALAKQKLLLLN